MLWKLLNAPWPEEGEFPPIVLEQASQRIHRYWITHMWMFVLGQAVVGIEAFVEHFEHPRFYLIPAVLMGAAYVLGFYRRITLLWLLSMTVLFVIQGMLISGLGGVTALSLTLPYTFAAMLLPGRKRVFIQALCVVGFWLSLLYDLFPLKGQLIGVKPYIVASYNILMATLTFQGLRFLNRLAIELNTTYVEREVTQQVTERSQQFLARVSHELRTPLNSVLGFAKLLRRTPLSPTQATYVTQVVDEGEQLNQLVGDLLDSAHLSSGKLTLKLEPCDVNAICSGVVDETQSMLKPGVTLHSTLTPDLPPVMADGLRLRQIVRNLAGNAAKYTAQGEIMIQTRLRQNHAKPIIEIGVIDTGPGIPADQQDMVFAPFVKRDHRSAGVGLGLDIARQLARLHGGDITLESIVGHGSTFTIELPVEKS